MNPIKNVSLIALASCLVCLSADAMYSSRSSASSADENHESRGSRSARHHHSPPVSLAPSALSSTIAPSSRGTDSPVPSETPTSASSSHRSHRSHRSSQSSAVASVAGETAPASSSSSSRRHHHSSRHEVTSPVSSIGEPAATSSVASSRRHHRSSHSSATSSAAPSVAASSVHGSQVFRAETESTTSSRAPSRSSRKSHRSDASGTSQVSARSSASALSRDALSEHNRTFQPLSRAAVEMLDAVSMSSSRRQSEKPLRTERAQHHVGLRNARQVAEELAGREAEIRALQDRYDLVVQDYLTVLNSEDFRSQQEGILAYLSDRTFKKHNGLFEQVAETTGSGATEANIATHLELYKATQEALPQILDRLARKDREAFDVISENWTYIQRTLDTLLEEDESVGTLLQRLTAARDVFFAENRQYLPMARSSASASRSLRDDAVTDYEPSIAATSVSLGSDVPSVAPPRRPRSERPTSSAASSSSTTFEVSSRTSSAQRPSSSRHAPSERSDRSHHHASRAPSVAASSTNSFAQHGLDLDAVSSWSITSSSADMPVAPASARSLRGQMQDYRGVMGDRETARRVLEDSVHTTGDDELAARLQQQEQEAAGRSSRHHHSSSSSRSSSRR